MLIHHLSIRKPALLVYLSFCNYIVTFFIMQTIKTINTNKLYRPIRRPIGTFYFDEVHYFSIQLFQNRIITILLIELCNNETFLSVCLSAPCLSSNQDGIWLVRFHVDELSMIRLINNVCPRIHVHFFHCPLFF